MTSMPASRSAAATTLAPRSWPSRPGLAISTRMGSSIVPPSENRRLAPGAEDLAQHVHHLAQRRVGLGALHEGGHEVHRRAGVDADAVERLAHLGGAARPAQLAQLAAALALGLVADLEHLEAVVLLVRLHELVDAHDDLPARLQLALVLVGRLADLALEPALLERRHHAAQLVDAREQLQRAALE